MVQWYKEKNLRILIGKTMLNYEEILLKHFGSKINFSTVYENADFNILKWKYLNIHRWLKIANITPHGPDDGSVEPKRYSVDFSINLSFHLDYLVINFSTHWNYKFKHLSNSCVTGRMWHKVNY